LPEAREKSISSTFYEQLLRQYFCTKKLKSQIVTREKQQKTLVQKIDSKMLKKLTPRDQAYLMIT